MGWDEQNSRSAEILLAHISYWLIAVLTEDLIPKICRATGPRVWCKRKCGGNTLKTVKDEKRESKTRTDKCHILVTVVELGI